MIVFNLENTLANIEQRAYFIDPEETHPDYERSPCNGCTDQTPHKAHQQFHKATQIPWVPDWGAFHDACDRDKVVPATSKMLRAFHEFGYQIEIWTGRPESSRPMTAAWIAEKIWKYRAPLAMNLLHKIRMRPNSITCTEEELKNIWLDETIASGKKVIMAVESDDQMVAFWTSRGITCIKVVPGEAL